MEGGGGDKERKNRMSHLNLGQVQKKIAHPVPGRVNRYIIGLGSGVQCHGVTTPTQFIRPSKATN